MKEPEKAGGKMIETIKIDFSAEMENITWEKMKCTPKVGDNFGGTLFYV